MKISLRWTMLLAAAALFVGMQARAQSDSDKEFLTKASQGNFAEIQLGKLASEKASNPQVKAFGEKMVHDHTLLGEKMLPFLQQAGITPPTSLNSEDQAEYDKLNGLSGAEFDKEYVTAMDKDHHADLAAFKTEIATTHDAALKKTVESGERVIAQHVRIIDGIAKKMGIQAA